MKTIKVYFIISILLFLFSCRDWNNPYDDLVKIDNNINNEVSVTTGNITNITSNSANISGNFRMIDVATKIDDIGICYAINSLPTINDYKVSSNTIASNFSCDINNLVTNTNYYVRAYLKSGTSGNVYYGDEKSFTTGKNLLEFSNINLKYISTNINNSMMVCVSDGNVSSGNSTTGDIAFVWQSSYGYSLCSPDAEWIEALFSVNGITYTLSDKKHTKIMKTYSNWNDVDYEYMESLNITEQSLTYGGVGVTNLSVGDVLAFETEDNLKGVLKVNSTSKVTVNLNIDLKVMQ